MVKYESVSEGNTKKIKDSIQRTIKWVLGWLSSGGWGCECPLPLENMPERFMELGLCEGTSTIRHIKNEAVTYIVFMSKVLNL